jgi:bifunctional non-homologous end joining protein LigD
MAHPPAKIGFIKPMLPSLVDKPPEGDNWIHEIKYDGYRTELVISGSSQNLFQILR